jgi:hypothetical protein
MAAAGKDVLMRRAGLCVVFAVFLMGCGSQESSESPNAFADSIAETRAANSSRFAISYGEQLVLTGVFDYDDGVGSLDERGDFPHVVFTKGGSFVAASPDAAEDGVDVYAAVLRGSGKDWIQVSDNAHSFGFAPPFVGDPNDLLRLLRGAIDVERLETGVERGAKVTRYKARLNVERALAELPEQTREAARASIKQYWTDGAKNGIPLDLSVDAQDRIRSLAFDVPNGDKVEIDFFEYGVDAGVETPSSDKVMSNEEFITRARSLCTKSGYGDGNETAACLVGMMLEDK